MQMMNNPFPTTPDAAAAALQAHARMADTGRKVVAGAAAQAEQPKGEYQRYACRTDDAAEGMFSSMPGMVREYQRVPCPDCGSPCLIRSSRQMSKLTREYSGVLLLLRQRGVRRHLRRHDGNQPPHFPQRHTRPDHQSAQLQAHARGCHQGADGLRPDL